MWLLGTILELDDQRDKTFDRSSDGREGFVNSQVSLKRNDREHFSNVDVVPRASNGDASLVAEAKSGSSLAFGHLYERHRTRTYRAAFRVLRNQEDAEDAVQRCFQRVLTNLSRFREESAFSTWVTRIAINEALMLLRQRRTNTASRKAASRHFSPRFPRPHKC
jgi:hypothetical protein